MEMIFSIFAVYRMRGRRCVIGGVSHRERYIAQRSMIPKGNLVEVRFDVFEQNGYTEMERIYKRLRCLGGMMLRGQSLTTLNR